MVSEDKKDEILSIYHEHFTSVAKTYKIAKEKGLKVTMKDVRETLAGIKENQKRKDKGKKNRFVAKRVKQEYQVDFAFFTAKPFAIGGDKYKFAIVVQDALSKYMFAKAMVALKSEEALELFKKCVKEMGKPESIYTDDDSVFKSVFGEYLKEEGIQHIITRGHAGVVERGIRTIKGRVLKRMDLHKKNRRWYQYLPAIVRQYNEDVHSVTDKKPKAVHFGKEEEHKEAKQNVEDKIGSKTTRVKRDFQVGDKVRLMLKSQAFSAKKIYTKRWSEEEYVIVSVEKVKSEVIYHLESEEGKTAAAHAWEIMKTT